MGTMKRTPKGVPQNDREKTTVRMSSHLAHTVDQLLVDTGVSKNAFFVMAIAKQAVTLATVTEGKALLQKIEREFQKEMKEARAALG